MHCFLAIKKDSDLPIGPALHASIQRRQSIAVPRRFDRPLSPAAADAALAIDIGHHLQQSQSTFHLWELIDQKFDGKGIGSEVRTAAKNLHNMPLIAQQYMLLSVSRL